MEKADWGAVVEIYYQGLQTNNAGFSISCPSYEDWDAGHIAVCRFIAETEGEVVGWAALSAVSTDEWLSGVAELEVYVDLSHCGRGVGGLLVTALLKASEDAGFWSVQSAVFESNKAALHLHEKHGFRTVGYRERLAKDRFGLWRNVVLLEHRISGDLAGGCDCDMVRALRGGCPPGAG
jgi:phosphinothricin acetyltransferase